jgi:hypothetical protein
MVNKLYLTPFRGRVIEQHSTQFFYATGTPSNAQVIAISRGEQSPRAALMRTSQACNAHQGLHRASQCAFSGGQQ